MKVVTERTCSDVFNNNQGGEHSLFVLSFLSFLEQQRGTFKTKTFTFSVWAALLRLLTIDVVDLKLAPGHSFHLKPHLTLEKLLDISAQPED